jgi:hypothetical protein
MYRSELDLKTRRGGDNIRSRSFHIYISLDFGEKFGFDYQQVQTVSITYTSHYPMDSGGKDFSRG